VQVGSGILHVGQHSPATNTGLSPAAQSGTLVQQLMISSLAQRSSGLLHVGQQKSVADLLGTSPGWQTSVLEMQARKAAGVQVPFGAGLSSTGGTLLQVLQQAVKSKLGSCPAAQTGRLSKF